MKKMRCPKCGKELIRLEPFQSDTYEFWCDGCNIELYIFKKEEYEMVKYTLKDYKKFCKEAFIMPPFEYDEQIDEWFETHKIHIIANNCVMELEYDADAINEIEFSLKEIHEAILGSGEATTGNTVGSIYRPATLKDIIRVALKEDWEDHGWKMESLSVFFRHFVEQKEDISDVICWYNIILKNIKHYTECYQCDFGKLDMTTMCNINPTTISNIVKELICTDIELLVGYDNAHKCSDITFVMDHTIKDSGELIGWFYGEQDEEYIAELIASYKNKLFGEEN